MNVPVPGGGYEPRQFSTWAPQLLSGIGTLPETVRDRAIEIEMVRKRPEEKVLPLRSAARSSNPAGIAGLAALASDLWETDL